MCSNSSHEFTGCLRLFCFNSLHAYGPSVDSSLTWEIGSKINVKAKNLWSHRCSWKLLRNLILKIKLLLRIPPNHFFLPCSFGKPVKKLGLRNREKIQNESWDTEIAFRVMMTLLKACGGSNETTVATAEWHWVLQLGPYVWVRGVPGLRVWFRRLCASHTLCPSLSLTKHGCLPIGLTHDSYS